MNTISIHIFPHEILEYERVMKLLVRSFNYIDNLDEIEIRSTLNKNPKLIEWANTKNQDEEITRKFISINESSPATTHFSATTSEEILGVNEHRRETIALANPNDTIIFLDCDLHFDERLLANQLNAIDGICKSNEYHIVSPQTIRLWDTTWDCLVHPSYKDHSFNFHKTANAKSIANKNYGEVTLTKNNTFKWGGGWFNAISANLLKHIGLPDSFVGYGPDDTFVMECCKLMHRANKNIQQYILNNMVVVEDRIPQKTNIGLRKDIPNFRENCNRYFLTELNKFKQKL